MIHLGLRHVHYVGFGLDLWLGICILLNILHNYTFYPTFRMSHLDNSSENMRALGLDTIDMTYRTSDLMLKRQQYIPECPKILGIWGLEQDILLNWLNCRPAEDETLDNI